MLIGAVFATQVALNCKTKPVEQLKQVVRAPVTQVAQFVPHVVVLVVTGLTHVAVPVYGAIQAVQVMTVVASVHAEQPTWKPVRVVVVAPELRPVTQLAQTVPLRTYPALQAVQVAAAELHAAQFVSVHVAAQREPPAREFPAEHVVHVVPAAVLVAAVE